MQAARSYTVVAAFALIAMWLTGCSRTTARHVNIDAGEYYSEQELETMSNRQKARYCSDLGKALAALQTEVEAKQDSLKNTRKEIDSLRNQITPLERDILRVDSDVRTLTGQIAELEALPKTHVVKPGETLDIIAMQEDIYNDPQKWPRIYRANMDKIDDPFWIFPDTVLVIPRDWPTEHKVVQGETLEIIAEYWEVYGDPQQWTRLYEANRKKVKDPNDLPPGLVLTIPRD